MAIFLRRFFWLIFVVGLTLGACDQKYTDSTPISARFNDNDIASATEEFDLELDEELKGSEDSILSGDFTEIDLSTTEEQLSTQARLPNSTGYTFYISYNASAASPWSIWRHAHETDVSQKVYEGNREIDSVAGSLDGQLVAVSMRETSDASSDFELYRLNLSNNRVVVLTRNSVDDTKVSMDYDFSNLVWQAPFNGISTIYRRNFVRVYGNLERLAFSSNQHQANLTSNGRFLALVRDLPSREQALMIYDFGLNSYTMVHLVNAGVKIERPSVSDDMGMVAWLERTPTQDILRTRNLNDMTITTQLRVASQTLKDPYLTSSGTFLTYSRSVNGSWKLYARDLSTNLTRVNQSAPANVMITSAHWPAECHVMFADDELRGLVASQINFYESKLIPCTRMSYLIELNFYYSVEYGVSSLAGLEHAKNLKILHIDFDGISAVDNGLKPMESLSGLEELIMIYLPSKFGDMKFLKAFSRLRSLSLYCPRLLNLDSLGLLSELSLLAINSECSSNFSGDISSLEALTKLESLDLTSLAITDINPLQNLAALTHIDLSHNRISDISALQGFTQLTALYLDDNQIEAISSLQYLTGLQDLSLASNQIEDISSLQYLTELNSLNLDDNRIQNINSLRYLTKLVVLGLGQNRITSIRPLVSNRGIGNSYDDTLSIYYNCLDSGDQADLDVLKSRSFQWIGYWENPNYGCPNYGNAPLQ